MKLSPFILLILTTLFSLPLQAAYTLKDGKLINSKYLATLSVQEHYSAAMEAYEKKDWEELINQATIVTKNFPTTPFAQEALYFLGVGYFEIEDYELANQNFSSYLKKQATPKHFEEAIKYKFAVAEKFQKGAKKHVMGWQNMPKWVPAREEAIAIYDEVITALPHHDLAAQALFGKAKLLLKDDDYKASIDAYQILIRRFPKHPLAIESYLGIAEVYSMQAQGDFPDPDLLDLAEINIKKFRQNFPSEERISQAEGILQEMQEFYAANLYETGQFFERTSKPHASYIYYSKIIAKYPNTKMAGIAKNRIKKLKVKPEYLPAKSPNLEENIESDVLQEKE